LESDGFFCGWQCDQVQNGVPGCDDKEMRDYCQQHGFDAWFETSAKDNVNIEEAARFLIARVSIVLLNIVAALCLAAVFYYTLHSFNGPLSRTTRVGRYQKGKTNLDFTEA